MTWYNDNKHTRETQKNHRSIQNAQTWATTVFESIVIGKRSFFFCFILIIPKNGWTSFEICSYMDAVHSHTMIIITINYTFYLQYLCIFLLLTRITCRSHWAECEREREREKEPIIIVIAVAMGIFYVHYYCPDHHKYRPHHNIFVWHSSILILFILYSHQ